MKKPLFQSALALVVLSTAVTLVGCPGGSPNQPLSTANMPPAGPGYGTIKGVVTAEGVQASSLRSVLQAKGVKGGKIKATSGIDTKEVDVAADGTFAVVVKGGADYTVEATVPDGRGGTLKVVSTKVTVPLAQDPPIVDVKSLVTRRTGTIQGVIKLKNAGSNDKVEGADVFLSGGTSVVGKAGETGRFALTAVAEGTWNLVVQKPGYKSVTIKGIEVKAGRPKLLDTTIELERDQEARAGIKGMVQDSNGNAIVGATVSAFPKDRALIANSDAGLDNFTAVSDDQGNFEMLNLPAGDYQVQVYRPFYQLPPRQDVTVAAGATSDLGTVKLVSNVVYFGKVSANVVDELGNPVDGAVVQLDPPVTDSQFVDAAGNVTLDRVMPGQYNVSVAAGGFKPVVMELRVDNEQNFQLNLGKLIMPASNPISDEPEATDETPVCYLPTPYDPIAANPDIFVEAGEDPTTLAPGPVTGPLTPAGNVSTEERFGRVVVNLTGMVDPETMAAIKLGKADLTVVEDGQVKAFKFTEAEESGRSLPVDIGMIIDVTGSMGGTLEGVKASAIKFIESLYAKNIDAQVGAVAYSDSLSGNPGRIQPESDPAAMTVTGFEYLTPFVDEEGLEVPGTSERKLRANRVTNFLGLLEPSGGAGWPEGMLDSLWWTMGSGKGNSNSNATQDNFGWRDRAQKVFIAMTDAPVWEKGGPEISPSSPWTVPGLADKLREQNAVVHMVSPDFGGYGAYDTYGDPKGLAVPLDSASTTAGASKGTGGSWVPLPGGGYVDLSVLPVTTILGNSVKVEFISHKYAVPPAPAKEHNIRVIVTKDGKSGESTFKLTY